MQVTATLPPASTPLPLPTWTLVPTATATVMPTPTVERTPAELWAERPIKDYPWCKDAALFEEFFVPAEELQNQAEFVRRSLTPDLFDPARFSPVSDYRIVDGDIIPSPFDNPPHFTTDGSAPFLKDHMCGTTEINGETYFTIQVPQYVAGVPADKWPVITGVNQLRSDMKGAWPNVVDIFKNKMNLVQWNVEDITIATKFVNPNTGVNFTREEVKIILDEMHEGNFANTNGLVLKFTIGDINEGWYR